MDNIKTIHPLLSGQEKRDFKNLLVVMTDKHIGNLLVALYVIKSANEQLREGQSLCCVVDANLIELAKFLVPEIDFLPFSARNKKQGIVQNGLDLLKLIFVLRRKKIDTAVDLYGHGESQWVARLSGADFMSAYHCKPKLRERYQWAEVKLPVRHQLDEYYHAFIPLQLPSEVGSLRAARSEVAEAKLKSRLVSMGVDFASPVVAIHPGAGKEYKLWPIKHWQNLIKNLVSLGCQVVLIGVGADKRHIEKILLDEAVAAIDACNQFSLIETVRMGFLVDVMVGNDSGPTHLMATTTASIFSLFGPTNIDLWAPLSSKSHILRSDKLCGSDCTKQECRENVSCLEALTPDVVFKAVSCHCISNGD